MSEHGGGGHGGGGGGVRELLAIFEFQTDTTHLKGAKNELGEFMESVKQFGEALLAAFAVEQIFEFTEAQVKAMTAVQRTATQMGIGTDAVQEYQFAAKSLGLDADSLTNSMGRLQVAQNAAANGGEKQAETFKKLGVNIRDSNGELKDGDAIFTDVAEGISKISDPAKQAGAAVALFGRNGRTLLPLLKKGAAGLAEYKEQYKELGGGYTKEAIEKAEKFEEQSAKLDLVVTNLKGTIAEELMPVFMKLMGWVQQGVKWFKELTQSTDIFRVATIAFIAVAGYLTAMLIIANLPLLAMIASFLILAIVVDDLIALFSGEDSQIGEWIDEAFGKGQSTEIVNLLKDAWNGVVQTFKEWVPVLKDAWEILKKVADVATIIPQTIFKVGQKVTGVAGDLAARAHNASLNSTDQGEDATAARQDAILKATFKKSAQDYIAAKQANPDAPENAGLAIPKGMSQNQALRLRQEQLDQINSGSLPAAPGAYGPLQSSDAPKIETHVTVNAGAGADGKEIGEAAAVPIVKAQQAALKDHAARLQTAGNKK